MALNIPFLNDLAKAFSDELPKDLGNLDEHVDYILQHVQPYSEDLREHSFWYNRRWKEVRDDAGFHESILHVFSETGEYLLAVDGNIIPGRWRHLGAENSMILEMGGKSELFDLAFLNPDFFILQKHGDQTRKGLRKYFVFVHEPAARNYDWRNLMELLYNVYRSDSGRFMIWIFIILVVLAVVMFLSLG